MISEDRRAQLRADLASAREEFHAMASAVSISGWRSPSRNPGWTNGQVLFHVLLGFILVLPLARLLVLFGRLPGVTGRAFAATLNVLTPVFHRINAVGPRAAVRVLGMKGVLRTFDRTHLAIMRRLDSIRDHEWELVMPYPTRWDSRFRPDMRLEDLFAYPVAHLRHHRTQLRSP
jgi:hypothetical protein